MSRQSKVVFLMLALGSLVVSGCSKTDYLYDQNPSTSPNKTGSYDIDQNVKASSADIIWQVGGMTELKQTMISGAKSFMTQLSARPGLDWKLGVISTAPADSPFLGFTTSFDSTTPNPVQPFTAAVSNVLDSSDGEQIMIPVENSLANYPNFVRKGSQLVIVVSNDAHDSSNEQVPNFLANLTKVKGSLSLVTVYAILGSTDLGCVNGIDEDWNYKGSTFEQIIQATNGKAFSLCTDDFGTALSKIGDSIVDLLTRPKFYLATRPIASTIQVELQGNILPGGPEDQGGMWSYDFGLNAVVFYNAKFLVGLAPGVQLNITYTEDTGLVAPTPAAGH